VVTRKEDRGLNKHMEEHHGTERIIVVSWKSIVTSVTALVPVEYIRAWTSHHVDSATGSCIHRISRRYCHALKYPLKLEEDVVKSHDDDQGRQIGLDIQLA
jgi:hypothetical protein